MSAKENLTLWMEPELQAQAAALFNALGMDIRRCVATVCLLRCVWMNQMKLPTRLWKRLKRMRMFTGRLIAWRI